jgi:hypothetical protein
MRQADPRPWLQDILETIEHIRGAVESMSFEAYHDWICGGDI